MHNSSSTQIFILGPTAVGKSEVAVELALQTKGEIVSADSMQIYKGMDIGTAKPLLEERKGIPHHLFDALDIKELCDVSRFQTLATAAISDIQKRGLQPIIVGGSGMYLRSLTQGLFEGPGRDEKLRAGLETLETKALHQRLTEADPEAAAKIGATDRRRMIRALEYFTLTGKPISKSQTQWKNTEKVETALCHPERSEGSPKSDHREILHFVQDDEKKNLLKNQVLIGLNRPRTELYRRCDLRVDFMFKNGFVDEVRGLIGHGLRESLTAQKAIGYTEVLRHLSGDLSLEKTIELVKQKTRNFVKRQMTWFRSEPGIQWLELSEEENTLKIVEKIRKIIDFQGE